MKKIVITLLCFLGVFLWIFILVGSGVTIGHNFNEFDNWQMYKKQKEITIGLDDSFVPMGFRNKDGKLTGYDIDLAKAVFAKYNIKVKFQSIDWLMKETELRNGTIDLIWNGYSKTNARQKVVNFSKPYLKNGQVLVTLKDQNINTTSDLKQKVIGVQSSSTGANVFMSESKVLKKYVLNEEPVYYDTFMNALNDLNAKRIQAVLIDRVYAKYYIKNLQNSQNYKILDTKFSTDSFSVGIRKHDLILKDKINNALDELEKNGELEKLNEKWFKSKQ